MTLPAKRTISSLAISATALFAIGFATAALAHSSDPETATPAPASASSPPAAAPAQPEPVASRCPDLLPPPALPETIADENAFNAGTETYNAWRVANEPIEACRQAEIRELQAQSRAITAQYNARIGEFRANDAEGSALQDRWNAARDAFIAKRSSPRKTR